jgi:hypothetical protein
VYGSVDGSFGFGDWDCRAIWFLTGRKLNFERHLLFRKLSEFVRIIWQLLLNKGRKLLKNSDFSTPRTPRILLKNKGMKNQNFLWKLSKFSALFVF